MAIKQVKRGWQCDWRDEYERRRYKTFISKTAAKDFLTREKARAQAAKHGTLPKRVTFLEFAYKWLQKVQVAAYERNKPRTYHWYKNSLETHLLPLLGDYDLSDLTPSLLRGTHKQAGVLDMLRKRDLGTKTIHNHMSTLGTLLREAYKQELTSKDLSAFLEKPKVIMSTENKRPFTHEEVGLFFQTCPREYHLYYATGIFAGMRTGEILALRFGDVDLRGNKIHVERAFTGGAFTTPKTGKGRIIDIIPRLRPFFAGWRHLKDVGGDLIFPGYDKDSLRKRVWIPTLRKMNVAYRKQYATRHTFASIMLAEGQPASWVAYTMGDRLETVLRNYHQWIPTEYKTELERQIPGLPEGPLLDTLPENSGGFLAVADGPQKRQVNNSLKSGTYWVSDGTRTHGLQGHNLAL